MDAKQIPIEAALDKMRELLEMVNRSEQERRDAILSALQAILQAIVNIDKGAAAVVLATDFNGSMGLYTLNANEDTVVSLIHSVLSNLNGRALNEIPLEQLGAMQ